MGRLSGDDIALITSGSILCAYGVGHAAAPKYAHKYLYGGVEPTVHTTARLAGLFGTGLGAADITVGATKGSDEVKKNLCKVAGVGWLTGAAMTAANVLNGEQTKNLGWANCALGTATGAALLWRGFTPIKKPATKAIKK